MAWWTCKLPLPSREREEIKRRERTGKLIFSGRPTSFRISRMIWKREKIKCRTYPESLSERYSWALPPFFVRNGFCLIYLVSENQRTCSHWNSLVLQFIKISPIDIVLNKYLCANKNNFTNVIKIYIRATSFTCSEPSNSYLISQREWPFVWRAANRAKISIIFILSLAIAGMSRRRTNTMGINARIAAKVLPNTANLLGCTVVPISLHSACAMWHAALDVCDSAYSYIAIRKPLPYANLMFAKSGSTWL